MGEQYKCENCGGIMEFDIATQSLKCANCDTTIAIISDKKVEEHSLTKRELHTIKATEKHSSTMECKGCGAKIEVDASCTATQCPYCGASYVLAEKQMDALIPDAILPFLIDKNKEGEIFRNWMKKRWLAPNELKHLYQQDRLQGVYMPYWTFDADADCQYTAMGGRDRQVSYTNSEGETEYRTETDWFFTSGRIQHKFDDVLEKASDKMKESLLKAIEPYDTGRSTSYMSEYIAGYSAECYTVDLEQAHEHAKDTMHSELYGMASGEVLLRFDHVKNINLSIAYSGETYKHILLPVYSTAYDYKGKHYTVLLNGQTGEIKGDYPKSPIKIAAIVIAILILLLGIFAVYNSGEDTDAAAQAEIGYVATETTVDRTLNNESRRTDVRWDFYQDNFLM
ncbi:MAG: hypothetical protein RRX92_06355 [Lachnospiraceae bacterium]